MLKRDPLASAMETNVGSKKPRWDKHEEDDAAEKGANEGVRVFSLAKPDLFISRY
jgi:hypothetical protein